MKAYIELVRKVMKCGVRTQNRTGTEAISFPGMIFEHDMSEGFPLLTTKSVPFGIVASELEFFIRGITDKGWLQDHGNHIWDEWCSPEKVAYGHDPATKKLMAEEHDLGPVYGWQWRHFGGKYLSSSLEPDLPGVDQFSNLLSTLKADPQSRRMLVSAWNPVDLGRMALPPCHYAFQVTVTEDRLNLFWNQRSVDVALGLPFNIASYGLLLHLLCLESGYKAGRLVGFLGDTHIYANHIEGMKLQLRRRCFKLPQIRTENFKGILKWSSKDTKVEGYTHHPRIQFEIAV